MIQSTLLTNLGIVHGYSERTEKREDFLDELGVRDITIAEQVHGIRIARVRQKGKILQGYDGLVSTNIPIGVTFADCVPILAVDPKAKIIGTVHAGWKGTLGGIAKELVYAMRGSGAKNIYVSIGPHIGACCYNVPKERAQAFSKKVISYKNDQWYLDLGQANVQLLIEAGIKKDHIDLMNICTSCNVDKFNSYRKDSKEQFGVQLGVITL